MKKIAIRGRHKGSWDTEQTKRNLSYRANMKKAVIQGKNGASCDTGQTKRML